MRCYETPNLCNLQALIGHFKKNKTSLRTHGGKEYDPFKKLLEYKKIKVGDKFETEYQYAKGVEIEGRLSVKGGAGLQFFSRAIRHTLAGDIYKDIDMKNAHPVLLSQICDKNEIPCPALKRYVAERDTLLKTLGDPGEGKQKVLKVMYGDFTPSGPDWLVGLSDEFKRIKEAIALKFPQHLQQQRGRKCKNVLGSCLSIVVNEIENKCLLKALELVPHDGNVVLCFDGFMVLKDVPVNLEALGAFVFEGTGYKVSFTEKPMNEGILLDNVPDEPTEDFTDGQACEYLLRKNPDFVKRNDKLIMFYDENTNLWTDNDDVFYRLLRKTFGDETKYANASTLKSVRMVLGSSLPIDEKEFFLKARERTRGRLLFSDGVIWNKIEMRKETASPDFHFGTFVPHPFPTTRPSDESITKIMNFMYNDPFPDEEVADWKFANDMEIVFAIDTGTFRYETGSGANGKSARANFMRITLGSGLVAELGGNAFALTKDNDPKSAQPALAPLEYARLALVREPPAGRQIDMSIIKAITGGDLLTTRGLYQASRSFPVLATLVFLLNGDRQFNECEMGFMDRRLRVIESPVVYTDTFVEGDPLIRKRDEDMVNDLMAHHAQDFLWLLVHKPIPKLPVPQSVMNNTRALIEEQDTLEQKFHERFVITGRATDKVSSKDLMAYLGLSSRELATKMRKWVKAEGTITIRIGDETMKGYKGLKAKYSNNII